MSEDANQYDEKISVLRRKLIDERDRQRDIARKEQSQHEDKHGGPTNDSEDPRLNYGPHFAFRCGFQAGVQDSIELLDVMVEELECEEQP